MSNNVGEKFCLRWNDFENNISSSFRELREDKDFFDVTLACEDNQLQAHKVILSACSPFFRSVLKRNPHQHPLLYLKGVRYESVLAVLNFMYHGEVNVAQEELNTFLSVAEDLKVKGLTQGSEKSGEDRSQSHKVQHQAKKYPEVQHQPLVNSLAPRAAAVRPVPKARPQNEEVTSLPAIKTETPILVEEDPSQDIGGGQLVGLEVQEQYHDDQSYSYEQEEYDTSMQGYDEGHQQQGDISTGDLDFDTFFNQNVARMDGARGLQCLLCSKISENQCSMKIHFEVHHYHLEYKCPGCPMNYRTKNSLCVHRKRKGH